MNKIAVIEIGGNQFLVTEGSKIKTKRIKLKNKDQKEIEIDKVLLFFDGKDLKIGTPYLENKVIGEILKEIKEKIVVGKFKPKTRYHKKIGTKLYFYEILIKQII
jgi:large subunit ribosomal protein L21